MTYLQKAYGPGFKQVSKLVKCNRCGDEQVAWFKTNSGKWCLFKAYPLTEDPNRDQAFAINKFEPHFLTCSAAKVA